MNSVHFPIKVEYVDTITINKVLLIIGYTVFSKTMKIYSIFMRLFFCLQFLVCALGVLFVLSWLGSVLNGFFAAWLVTLLALLAPGLKKNGVLDRVIQLVMSKAKLQ